MKLTFLLLITTILTMGKIKALNLGTFNGENEKTRLINNKKFYLMYEEVAINASLENVWNEVAGNFTKGVEIAQSINASYGLTGDLKSGLGAERYLSINFLGKILEVKERIIDFQELGDHHEFTYEVYETKGSPIKVNTYNTWSVRTGKDRKTYLGNLFIYRANLGFLTGIIGKKMKNSGSIRTGLLTYKHYLETGEKKVDAALLNELYPQE